MIKSTFGSETPPENFSELEQLYKMNFIVKMDLLLSKHNQKSPPFNFKIILETKMYAFGGILELKIPF